MKEYILISVCSIAVLCVVFCLFTLYIRQKHIKELTRKNAQLIEAVNQAMAASESKGDFLARMSHEIRTPMNAIVGLTTIAKNHINEPSKLDEYLDKIDSSSKMLLGIINDVLDMSAIENKKLKIAK